jgi:beta-1,3-galactosyltransferase 1
MAFENATCFLNANEFVLLLQASLEQEHEQYNDLVQHNFIDSFANLTLKTTFLLKWILSNECQTSKFIFKTDDDTLVNPTQLWNSLDHALLHT